MLSKLNRQRRLLVYEPFSAPWMVTRDPYHNFFFSVQFSNCFRHVFDCLSKPWSKNPESDPAFVASFLQFSLPFLFRFHRAVFFRFPCFEDLEKQTMKERCGHLLGPLRPHPDLRFVAIV